MHLLSTLGIIWAMQELKQWRTAAVSLPREISGCRHWREKTLPIAQHQCAILAEFVWREGIANGCNKSQEIIRSTKNGKCDLAVYWLTAPQCSEPCTATFTSVICSYKCIAPDGLEKSTLHIFVGQHPHLLHFMGSRLEQHQPFILH